MLICIGCTNVKNDNYDTTNTNFEFILQLFPISSLNNIQIKPRFPS